MTGPDGDPAPDIAEAGLLAPPDPLLPAARRVFGSRLEAAEQLAALLAGPGVTRGLLGPREVSRLWDRHLLNCAVVGDRVPRSATVADVGSGAGLPGLALALARPDVRVTLIEPLQRRTAFLDAAVAALQLEGVEVVRARAEELHGRHTFAVVASRAVAPLDRLTRWCWPLVAPRGVMVALKGRSAAEEIAAARPELRRLRVQARTHSVGSEATVRATVVEVSPA